MSRSSDRGQGYSCKLVELDGTVMPGPAVTLIFWPIQYVTGPGTHVT